MEDGEPILGHSVRQTGQYSVSRNTSNPRQAPGGSSTGSAVSVGAGYAPLSIGSETVGSIVTPACRQALYALKPTVGSLDLDGVFQLTSLTDSAGPMAKSPGDLISILNILMPSKKFENRSNLQGLRIGFGDPDIWRMSESVCPQKEGTFEQMVRGFWNGFQWHFAYQISQKDEYMAMIDILKSAGASVRYPAAIPEPSEFGEFEGESSIIHTVACISFSHLAEFQNQLICSSLGVQSY